VLCSKGFRCEVPDTTGVAAADGPYYPKYAAAVAAAVDDDQVVLIGHSAAGPLLPAIADVLSGHVLAAIFADATLPHPKLSWFDAAPPPLRKQLRGMADGGRLPPWHEWFPPGALDQLLPDPALRGTVTAEIPRMPLAYFEEPAPATTAAQRCAFLRFSAAYDQAADHAEQLGWWVARRDWDHLRMLTAPDAVADLIASAISALRAG
jgi:hypothetical protein